MKTKEEIVANWLPRYTKRSLNDFGEYILLTNFNKYVELFADKFNVPVLGRDANMTSAHAEGITIINFGMGSPNAAIIMDLLGAIQPKACLFLGKCGGIDRKNKLGDLILPIAAIRGEGTSNDYYPPEVPALPAFMLQRAVSSAIRDHARDYWTGTVYTPTAVYGSMMRGLKSISLKRVPCVWIWKRLRCLLLVFTIIFLLEHYFWYPTSR